MTQLIDTSSRAFTFLDCVEECLATPELVKQFDRLSGTSLGQADRRTALDRMIDEATGYVQELHEKRDAEMQMFIKFVYDCVWTRLPF